MLIYISNTKACKFIFFICVSAGYLFLEQKFENKGNVVVLSRFCQWPHRNRLPTDGRLAACFECTWKTGTRNERCMWKDTKFRLPSQKVGQRLFFHLSKNKYKTKFTSYDFIFVIVFFILHYRLRWNILHVTQPNNVYKKKSSGIQPFPESDF